MRHRYQVDNVTNQRQEHRFPDCDYLYDTRGRYTVTASTAWTVRWRAAGFTGTIPLALKRSSNVLIGELHTVNVKS